MALVPAGSLKSQGLSIITSPGFSRGVVGGLFTGCLPQTRRSEPLGVSNLLVNMCKYEPRYSDRWTWAKKTRLAPHHSSSFLVR